MKHLRAICGKNADQFLPGSEGFDPMSIVCVADYKLKKDGTSVSATLRTLFYTLPRLLIVHLSRFTYTATGQGKVHKRVQFDARMK